MTTAALARHFKVPADVVRYRLEQFPLEPSTSGGPVRREPIQDRLTKADFLLMYDRDGMTLKAIAAKTNANPGAVANLARKYGIPLAGLKRSILTTRVGCTKSTSSSSAA